MNRNLAHSGRIFYIRIMGEANGYWNPYCPFNADGSARPGNSTSDYRQAWRRTVLILRGGSLQRIDSKLHALGLPAVRTKLRRSASLPRPKVTFIWAPQTSGDPNLAANEPGQFWPGSQYVDWVGTDFYEGDNFTYLNDYYNRFSGKPFDLGEWGVYVRDDPSFVQQVFTWVRNHSRLRMFNYYQGFDPHGRASLSHYPQSAAALRRAVHNGKFPQYAREYAHPPPPKHHHHHHHHPPPPPPKPPKPGPPPTPPQLCVKLLGIPVCIPGL
jgi:hypothetical protein